MATVRRSTKTIEGVTYYPFVVSFKLADGRRRRMIRWSPGYPWVYDEVGRELLDRFGEHGIRERSCTIRELAATMPSDVRTPYGVKRARVSLGLVQR